MKALKLFSRKDKTEQTIQGNNINSIIQKVCKETGWTRERAEEGIRRAELNYKATPEEYYNLSLYRRKIARQGLVLAENRKKVERIEKRYQRIQELTGKDQEQVHAEMRRIRKLYPEDNLHLNWYFFCGVYDIDIGTERQKLNKIIEITRERWALAEEVAAIIDDYERFEIDYAEIKEQIEKYTDLTEEVLSEAKLEEMWERVEHAFVDRTARDSIVLDIIVANLIFGFSVDEYISFHLRDKKLEEWLTYLPRRLRTGSLAVLNSVDARRTLSNKFQSYKALKPLYGREVKQFNCTGGFEAFAKYAETHPVFVKKINYGAKGQGVEIVHTNDGRPLREIYDEITSEGQFFVAEEVIRNHEVLRSLNPDSVNTVRVITYKHGEDVIIDGSSMKIGRAGRIVDNGGAGGIMVHIDEKTGIFDSDGIDETGKSYETHPDHGYTFRGFQLPAWEQALETAKAAALAIDGANYVGWDLTCKEDGQWIVVEGNGATQFMGQQAATNQGKRKHYLQLVHDDLVAAKKEQENKKNQE